MALAENANVGKTVATRVGKNIREVRVKLELTQAQLAAFRPLNAARFALRCGRSQSWQNVLTYH